MDSLSPYFTTSCGALFAEDSLQFMRRLNDDCVGCIFADPPLNLGKDYKSGFDDRRSRKEYLD